MLLLGAGASEAKQNIAFKIEVSDTQACRQFGNSIVVAVFIEGARIMERHPLP